MNPLHQLGFTDLLRESEPWRTDPGRASERQWWAAIASATDLLREDWPSLRAAPSPGLLMCGPLPVLGDQALLEVLQPWIWMPEVWYRGLSLPAPCLPGAEETSGTVMPQVLALTDEDPLAREQFCLLLTPALSLVLCYRDGDRPSFQFSFEPEVLRHCALMLWQRTVRVAPAQARWLQERLMALPPVEVNLGTASAFMHRMLAHLESQDAVPVTQDPAQRPEHEDVELVQALAHEVQTPLTTIRTLTRSLLRRSELSGAARQRLESIDQECSEQIDRFGLIFRAAEIDRQEVMEPPRARTALAELLAESLPRWQRQAERRGLELRLDLPESLPAVVSDPALLAQALGGLMDRCTRNLPGGSRLCLAATVLGGQLKLMLRTQASEQPRATPTRELGRLLVFRPQTGSLGLNLQTTRQLFQRLGGRLTVQQISATEEQLTVFLPLETDHAPGPAAPR